jgi:hypothetical protein
MIDVHGHVTTQGVFLLSKPNKMATLSTDSLIVNCFHGLLKYLLHSRIKLTRVISDPCVPLCASRP